MKISAPLVVALLAASLSNTGVQAQTAFASGLQLPSKITFTPRGHLLVAENGSGPNAGRVSIVDRITGTRRTLIDGLPSGINSAEGMPAPSGPSGVFLNGNVIYVLIAEGDGVLAGPLPGTQQPNPTPASPILSSLLQFTLPGPIDTQLGNLSLTPADHAALKAGQTVRLNLGGGADQATAKLVVDFANYRSVPRPDFQANVQHSDPYGLVVSGGFAYVADAGQNSIRKVDLATGNATTLADFPPVANTTGVGGPVIEAVPDSIRLDGNRLLVTLLSGFPFAPGFSKVVAVDPSTGGTTTLIDQLTTAIDAVPISSGATRQYVISEFSTDLLMNAPGRILLASNSTDKTVLASGIVSPASIAVDPRTGEIFAAQIFTGTIARIDASASLPAGVPSTIIPVVTSVAGSFSSRFETSLQLSNPHPYTVSGVMNIIGAVTTRSLPYHLAAFESKTYPNLMSAAGATGGATMDIDAAVGPSPAAIVRIYDTSRSSSSTGTIIKQLTPDDALQTGETSVLVSAADPTISRTNIGTRPLAAGATLLFTLYRADGTLASTARRTFAANRL
ncbi:MAG: hypothetical protein JWO56_1195, partial [Acidobacteria bacterium]|nr:hypothetical protein [Acidobacteriota bacterium]